MLVPKSLMTMTMTTTTNSSFTEGFKHQTWSCPCREVMPGSCLLEITTNQQNAEEPWYDREKNQESTLSGLT